MVTDAIAAALPVTGEGVAPIPDRGLVSEILLQRLARRVVAGEGRERMTVIAPATGAVLGEVPRCCAEDVRHAARCAAAAQESWSHTPLVERTAVMHRYHDLILDRQDEILDLVQLETGKARKNAFEEVADVAIVSRYYASTAQRHLRPKRRKGALPALTATWESRVPIGLVGFISPWNYPLSLAVTDAIPALLAGNGVLLKPDSETPFTALWAVDLLEEAGLPAGLFQVVTGPGSELGQPLIESVGFITFTGSTATGRRVALMAAERLIGCSLELGGKNSMIVLADADLDAAVDGAVRGCFANAGQLCISVERLFVHQALAERFVDRFVAKTRALRLGAGLGFDSDVGSLISVRQLETVLGHVQDAVDRGAIVLAGGRPRPDIGPCFFEPTILTGVTEQMRVYAEETFGPVVSLYPFESLHETIEKTNASPYGLNASVWTRNEKLGRRVGERIQAGTVNVNEAYAAAWASVDAPMGGFKDSGLGRRHGAEGILKYTEAQTIAVQRVMPLAAPPGMDDKTFAWVMTKALKGMSRVPGL